MTEQGRQEVGLLAKRFEAIPIDLIITSDYPRAKETAEIINRVVQKKVEISDLLRERRRPSEFYGKEIDDPEVLRIARLITMHRTDVNWHFSDEENFFDLKARSEKFISFIQKFRQNNILVSTHGTFLRTILLTVMLNKSFTEDIFHQVIEGGFLRLSNACITICEFTDGRWRLIAWNDVTHLEKS